jgi:WD40 repeat protein/serine/threonine protein kinase
MEDPKEKPSPEAPTILNQLMQATTVHANAVNTTVQVPVDPPKKEPDALPVLPTNLRYEGMEEFARGGLGRIVKANDKRLNRPVAMKELLKSRGSAEARFLREAYITAKLEHPSIIPVHDAGRWPDGAPFFTMKLVAGKSLKEAIDDTKTLPDRLALLPHLLDTAEAIAYAHSKGIIHRDIKPHNILVGGFGETVVIDWGIAKEAGNRRSDGSERGTGNGLTPEPEGLSIASPRIHPGENENDESENNPDLTKQGAVMGTPAYMPPEQAAGKSVDERADVYALGAILYYLLAGRPPYTGSSGKHVVAQVIAGSPAGISSIEAEAPKDLIAIAEKAMARDPKDRYPSAKEMAQDLRHYQLGGLVGAHKYTLQELISRWIKKNKLTVAVASSLLLVMLIGGTASVVSIVRANNKAQAALIEEEKQRKQAEEQRALAEKQQQLAEESSNQLRLLQARDALDRDPAATLAWLKEMSPRASGWSYAKLLAQETQRRGASTNVFRGHSALVHYMAFSPDGKLFASASKDGTLRLWDVEARSAKVLQVSSDKKMIPSEISAAAFSSDGVWLAAADNSGLARVWRTADVQADKLEGSPVEGHSASIASLLFSPDNKTLITGSADTLLLSYDLETKARTPLGSQESPVRSITLSSTGSMMASVGQDGSVIVWDLASRLPTRLSGVVLQDIPVRFLEREEKLVGATPTGVLLWSMRDLAAAPLPLPVEGETPTHIEVSPDGRWLGIAGQEGRVRLWSFIDKSWRVLQGNNVEIEELRFSSDGKTLAVASRDKLVWLWDTETSVGHALKGHLGAVKTMAFTSDGKTLASVCDYNAVRLWDISSGAEFGASIWGGHDAQISDMDAAPDAEWLFSVDEAGGVWEHSISSGKGALITRSSTPLYAVAVSPDQKWIAFAGKDAEIRLLQRETGEIQSLKAHSDVVRALAFSPDGKYLASGSDDATLLFWDLSTRTPQQKGWFPDGIYDVAFSPDGSLLAIGAQDRAAHLLQLSTEKIIRVPGHLDFVSAVAFSRDGKWFASGSLDKSIWVYSVDSLLTSKEGVKPMITLDGHGARVNQISFSTDGNQLLSTSDDHTTRLWDIKSAQSVIIQNLKTQGHAAFYLQKSEQLVSSNEENALLVWPNPKLPDEPTALVQWLSNATTAKVGKDYKLRSNQ